MNTFLARSAPLLALIASWSHSAYARLGETETELAKRFGPLSTQSRASVIAEGRIVKVWPRLTFRQGDWSVRCDMVEDRCAKIHYSKPGEWSEEQFQTVLASNAQGATWSDISKSNIRKVAREWKRSDGATAVWKASVGMTVTSPAYERAKAVEEAKVKAQSKQIPKI